MKKFWVVLGIIFAIGLLMIMFIAFCVFIFLADKKLGLGSDGVAIVNVVGEISLSKPVTDLLHEYEKLPRVRAIVLRVDSPGGSVAATQEIYEEVSKIRKKGEKAIVASLGSVAASGGYYVACGADKIVANPGTLTGSIGVLMSVVNMKELLEKVGINIKTITSGEHKDIGSLSRELTPEEEELLKQAVYNIHKQFLRVVEERRGLTAEELKSIADGRIFTGEQALEHKLVDEMGNLTDAIDIAAKQAGIVGEPKIIEQRRRFSLFQFIFGETELRFPLLAVRYGI